MCSHIFVRFGLRGGLLRDMAKVVLEISIQAFLINQIFLDLWPLFQRLICPGAFRAYVDIVGHHAIICFPLDLHVPDLKLKVFSGQMEHPRVW